MIRIAFICDSLEIGGQELGLLELIRRLDRARFSPFLYAFRPGALLPETESLGIPFALGHHKPGADPRWTDEDAEARRQWHRQLTDRLRADAIDACIVYAWPEGVTAAQQAQIKAIVERLDGPALVSRVRDKSPCQRVICESKSIRDMVLAQRGLLRCSPGQLVVIPNGIDLTRFDPEPYDRARCREALDLGENDFVVGTVARLAKRTSDTCCRQ